MQLFEKILFSRRNSDFVALALLFFVLAVAIAGFWDAWVVGMVVGLFFAIGVRFALRWKEKVLSEPLRSSMNIVRQRIDSRSFVMARVILGRGRPFRLLHANATLQDDVERTLSVAWKPECVVGPFTIAINCPHAHGRLRLHIVGMERGRRIELESEWALSSVENGDFEPIGSWNRGRLTTRAAQWDKIRPCGS